MRFRGSGPRVLIALLGLAAAAWLAWGSHEPLRVLLVAETPQAGDLPTQDLAPLFAFATDLLEAERGAAVTLAGELPTPEAYRQFPKKGLLLRLRARRQGPHLELGGAWIRIADYARGGAWHGLSAAEANPAEALEAFLAALPLPPIKGPGIVPKDPTAFWELFRAADLSRFREQREPALALASAALAREPDNPAAHWLLGHLYAQRAAARGPSADADVAASRAHLEACLRAHPAYPRAVSDWMGFLADTGECREALARFAAYRRATPDAIPLFTGLGYSARYAGHMQALEKATDRLEELHLFPGVPWRLQVGLLYLGRREAYAASLRDYSGDPRNSLVLFLRGHLACLQGRPSEALALFRTAEQESSGLPHFVQLAGIFSKILGGDEPAALVALTAMERERQGLLTPDGEVTLHLAEAHCLLGNPEHGLDLMERAFSHGFGCTPWFEQDPLLEPARRLPRWRALQRHLQERQALIEAQFPLDRLGF